MRFKLSRRLSPVGLTEPDGAEGASVIGTFSSTFFSASFSFVRSFVCGRVNLVTSLPKVISKYKGRDKKSERDESEIDRRDREKTSTKGKRKTETLDDGKWNLKHSPT